MRDSLKTAQEHPDAGKIVVKGTLKLQDHIIRQFVEGYTRLRSHTCYILI